jgi:hypothetical protein
MKPIDYHELKRQALRWLEAAQQAEAERDPLACLVRHGAFLPGVKGLMLSLGAVPLGPWSSSSPGEGAAGLGPEVESVSGMRLGSHSDLSPSKRGPGQATIRVNRTGRL